MKEPYREAVARHPDPESCVGDRKVAGEALTGAHAGQPLSSEITTLACRPCPDKGKATSREALCESLADATESKNLSMCENSLRENRETQATLLPDGGRGRSEKASGQPSDMHVAWESDDSVVPAKRANKAERSAAESVEGRGSTKGNTAQTLHVPDSVPGQRGIGLRGVRQASRRVVCASTTQGKSRMK